MREGTRWPRTASRSTRSPPACGPPISTPGPPLPAATQPRPRRVPSAWPCCRTTAPPVASSPGTERSCPGDQSWAVPGTGVPAVSRPCPSDQATHGDDGVGEVEECVDDGGAPFVAAGEPVEGVLPGVGAFDVRTPAGLDGRLLAFMRDAAAQAAFAEQPANPCSTALTWLSARAASPSQPAGATVEVEVSGIGPAAQPHADGDAGDGDHGGQVPAGDLDDRNRRAPS